MRGVLFDKDGTLIDFEALWIPASQAALQKAAATFGWKEGAVAAARTALGIRGGHLVPGALLATGTYADMARAIERAAQVTFPGGDPGKILEALYAEAVGAHPERIRPLPGGKALRDTLASLRARGIRLGVATQDGRIATERTLDACGILAAFDAILTAGMGYAPKPAADIGREFCRRFGLQPQELAVVGDTAQDIAFARSIGAMAIAVRSGVGALGDLASADCIIDSVADLESALAIAPCK